MNTQNDSPITDTIMLPANGIAGSNQVTVSVSCELMKNQRRASPLDPGRNILVVQDSNGQPMIFTIGTDAEFHLLKYEDGSATGWKVINLSEGFTGYDAAGGFAITQDAAGRISIVLALSKPKAVTTDVFVASMLSSDSSQTDWTKFSTLCRKVSGLDARFAAEEMIAGTSDDGNTPLIVVAGNIDGSRLYYQLEGEDNSARKLEFPEDVDSTPDSLIDMSLGYAFGQRGTFFLYKVGETKTLECTTLATPDEGSLHFDYSPGNPSIPEQFQQLEYNCIATPAGSQTSPALISSDIYVGTETGIYLFRDARVETLQKVTDRIKDVHEIIVTQDADNISVWALASPNELYYIYGKKGDNYAWHAPVLFNKATIHIAPIRSQIRKANELFLVNQDQSITHHWQDPASTLWHQSTLKLKDENLVLDYNSFTTQIHVEDENGNNLAGQTLKVSSSEWAYVEANGLIYSLDRDNPAEIEMDVMGTVTLINMPTDISTPIFHVEADFFDKTLNIYPNGKVKKGIQAIKTGDDLKNATTQDGKPVLTESYDQATLNGVAGNLGMLADASNQFGGPESGSQPYTFVVVEEKAVKHTGALDLTRVPDFAMGMRVQNGKWEAFDVSAAQGSLHTAAAFGFLDDIVDFTGDALHYLEHGFEDAITEVVNGITQLKDGISFVIQKVKDGFTLVINFAKNEVLKIVLDTVGAVFKAISWVLKLVKVTLGKILQWLGHLFGWDDIWKTHKVLASMMTSLLDYGVERVDAELEQWQAGVDQFLEQVRRQIKSIAIPDDLPNTGPRGGVVAGKQASPNMNLKSPPANWAFYHVQHGGLLAGGAVGGAGSDPITQFVKDVVVPTATAFGNDFARDLADLQRLFTDPSVTYQDVVRFFSDVVDTVIDPAKALIDGVLKFIRDLLEDIKRLLEEPLDIPFLSSFYEFVTDLLGEKEELTAINAVALLVSIPYTVLYKVARGGAPFEDGAQGMDDPHLFHNLLGTPAADTAVPAFAAAGTSRALPDARVNFVAPKTDAKAVYSQLGGALGSFSAILASLSGLLAFVTPAREEGVPPDNEEGKLNIAQKAQLAFSLAKYAGTLPMPKDGGDRTAYFLRVSAYGVSAIYPAFAIELPNRESRGGFLLFIDTIALIISLVADSLGDADWWTWVSDTSSNGAGILQGIGLGIPEPRISAAVAATGIGVSAGAAIFGLDHALMSFGGDVIYLVNVAG